MRSPLPSSTSSLPSSIIPLFVILILLLVHAFSPLRSLTLFFIHVFFSFISKFFFSFVHYLPIQFSLFLLPLSFLLLSLISPPPPMTSLPPPSLPPPYPLYPFSTPTVCPTFFHPALFTPNPSPSASPPPSASSPPSTVTR